MKYSLCKAKSCFLLLKSAKQAGLPPIMARYGLTLAEVLITLGIIGVVSAITIPALISKYYEHQTNS